VPEKLVNLRPFLHGGRFLHNFKLQE